jgi:YfiH family protein
MIDVIQPNWPAPPQVKAFTTTRMGGFSLAPFDTFNLATHVGDNKADVIQNRNVLQRKKNLPHAPLWLEQNHTITVVSADLPYDAYPVADASYSFLPERVCAVLTADCLPLLICDSQGTQVAAVHAGWRGLAQGIVPATVEKLRADPKNLLVWLGPAIGPEAFEVKDDVRDMFLHAKSGKAEHFKETSQGVYLADMYAMARFQLNNCGVEQVFGGDFCTYNDPERFFSYRRNNTTGRMASVIWLSKS